MHNKKRIILSSLAISALVAIVIFSLWNWDVIKRLCYEMVGGVAIAKEYILDAGVVGFIAISVLIVMFFFFPVISSVPIQIASAISYGLIFGILHVTMSVFIASQLNFLFVKCVHSLRGKKKQEKQIQMEEKIRNSRRSIEFFLIAAYVAPFVPFFLIHTVAASSGMKWWKYSLITLLGPIPDIVLTLWLGVKITSSKPVVSYVILMVIILCVVLSLIFKEKILDLIFVPKKEGKNGKS